jgi:hypothetical protein
MYFRARILGADTRFQVRNVRFVKAHSDKYAVFGIKYEALG